MSGDRSYGEGCRRSEWGWTSGFSPPSPNPQALQCAVHVASVAEVLKAAAALLGLQVDLCSSSRKACRTARGTVGRQGHTIAVVLRSHACDMCRAWALLVLGTAWTLCMAVVGAREGDRSPL